MRLTLRTLLAWLDGILMAEEQRSLGERVSDSAVASGLTRRILAAVVRADLEAPRVDSWGTLDDANFVADYLDNRLHEDRLESFERMCLQSEPRLAEVADCHGALAEMSRIGAGVDMPTTLAAPTRERLKQLVHGRGRGSIAPAVSPHAAAASVSPAASDDRTGHGKNAESAAASGSVSMAASAPPFAQGGDRFPVTRGDRAKRQHAPAPTPPPTQRSSRKGPAAGGESADRLAATVAVVAMLAVGVGAVAWLNFGGHLGGPGRGSVQGFVTFDGAPLETGVVVMLPAGETKGPTAGSAISNGAFSIAAASGPAVGRYRVEVKAIRKTGRQLKAVFPVGGIAERDETEQFIPSRYNLDSEIEIEIKPGRNKISLELKSEPKPASKPGAQTKPPRIVAGRERLPGNAAPGGRPG